MSPFSTMRYLRETEQRGMIYWLIRNPVPYLTTFFPLIFYWTIRYQYLTTNGHKGHKGYVMYCAVPHTLYILFKSAWSKKIKRNGTVPGFRAARIIEFNRNLRYDLNFEFESGPNQTKKFQIRIHITAIQTSTQRQRNDKKTTLNKKYTVIVSFYLLSFAVWAVSGKSSRSCGSLEGENVAAGK